MLIIFLNIRIFVCKVTVRIKLITEILITTNFLHEQIKISYKYNICVFKKMLC